MKTITVTGLLRTYKTIFRRIPEDGILVTKNGKIVGKIVKPDLKKKQEEVAAKAKEVIRTIKIDTFTEVEAPKQERTMGTCDRCGGVGEVKKSGYLNENGRIVGKWICISKCEVKSRKDHSLQAGLSKDFGGINE